MTKKGLDKNFCSFQDDQLRFLFFTILAAEQFWVWRQEIAHGLPFLGAMAQVLPDLGGILGDILSFV